MEELEFHLALHRPGLMLDIGAHDGLLSLPFARLPNTHLHAFEPLPAAMARLRAAFAGLPGNVTLHEVALGASPGEAWLTLPVLGGIAQEQWASISKDYAEHSSITTQQHRVAVITLDSLGLQGITGIKLDAEGAEQEVLEGARMTLATSRPVLSIEIEERHRAGATRDVPALLATLGYAGFFWHAGALRPLAAFDATTMQVASPDPAVFAASEPYIFSFFFLPIERSAADLEKLQRAR